MKWDVNYKVYANKVNEGMRCSYGASDYKTQVEAPNQGYAQQLVQNQNGGPEYCQILSCRLIF